jgi:quercetin dioxygenase-like cupin family protein
MMKEVVATFLLLGLGTSLGFGQTVSSNPQPGRLEGTTAFVHASATPAKATKTHPTWFRGTGENGIADDNAKYAYHELIGPKLPAPAFQNNFIYSGPLEMKPGYTYPAHSHPAPEFYYVIDGEADWYVDDESQHVTPGSLIYHRPFASHGWTVTGDKPLKAMWVWWSEEDPSVLNASAKMVNSDLASKQETAKPMAVPLPKRQAGTTAFLHASATPAKATKTHPAWFRGTGANGIADDNAKYAYHELIGPKLPPPAFQNNFIYSGPLEMKPGYTYPAHSHPAAEFYYVIDGEADWYVDDESQHVTPGSLIYHRPFASHGWTVTGDKPLKAMWVWWSEGDPSVLNASAKMVNPDLASKQETAKPMAVPVPAVRRHP